MSRNDERIGSPVLGAATILPAVKNLQKEEVIKEEQNLSFVMPTEFIDLPSKGKYYPSDSYLFGKEQIELRFMTTKDEDILNSKSLLKKGIAIERLLQGLIIDKKIKLDEMFVFDKNALVIAARIAGYGADYKTKVSCPSCNGVSEIIFDLSTLDLYEGDSTTLLDDGLLIIELPKTKAKVACKILTGKDEKFLTQLVESKKKNHLAESPLSDLLKAIILSINGDDDRHNIALFIDNMPSIDSRYLRNTYNKSIPNVNMKKTIECSECETAQEVNIPLTAEFFWPNG